MAHVLTYTYTPQLDQAATSSSADVIISAYIDSGKLTSAIDTAIEGTSNISTSLTFLVEADCDAFLSEMHAINEETTTGSSRSGHTRTNT